MPAELLLIGMIGGLIGGLLGVGGGTIYVPVLVLIYGTTQQLAQGISLGVMIPMACLGSYAYFRQGSVRLDIFWELVLGSIFGAFIGASFANHINGQLLQQIFSIALALIGLKMVMGK
ncbi:TSUP family transporter [Candidatus Margulisiibacteriota bacterium]